MPMRTRDGEALHTACTPAFEEPHARLPPGKRIASHEKGTIMAHIPRPGEPVKPGEFTFERHIRIPKYMANGDYLIDLFLHEPLRQVYFEAHNCQILHVEGFYEQYANPMVLAKGGGQIAGWKITDTSLSKNDTGMASSNVNFTRPDGISDTKAFYSTDNFYATHNGYLFSKLGQIAGWDITPYQLNKGTTVGMNSINIPNETGSITISVPTSEDGKTKESQTKAFFANGDNFYVTHQGFLKSNAGRIGNWHISTSGLSNIDESGNKLSLSPTSGIQLLNGSDATKKFKVNANGQLESTFGKIGGWTIGTSSLTAGNTHIDSTGNIYVTNNNWAINSDGNVSFQSGTIGKVLIANGGLEGDGWYIRKDSAKIPGLTVTNNAIYYSSTGTISGNGGQIGSSPGSTAWNPSQVRTTPDGPTLEHQIKEWVCEAIGTGTLTIYEGIKAINGKYTPQGNAVIKMEKGNAVFKPPVQVSKLYIAESTYTSGSRGGYAKTLSGILTFSNQATLTFSNGLLIGEYIPANVSGMNWT